MLLFKLKERAGLKGVIDIDLDKRAESTEELPWLFFLVLYIAISNRRQRKAG